MKRVLYCDYDVFKTSIYYGITGKLRHYTKKRKLKGAIRNPKFSHFEKNYFGIYVVRDSFIVKEM